MRNDNDKELTYEHNVQIIASALLDVMKVLYKIGGAENRYIRGYGVHNSLYVRRGIKKDIDAN